jgi:hypothetical protein
MGAWWISNYDEAKVYLAGGRKKWDRPMYMRGLRLQNHGKDIAIVDKWYGFNPVLFHPDGTLTIQAPPSPTNWGGTWNPLRSQGVRYNIKHFGKLQGVFQKGGNIYITTQDALRTPSKVQKCRSCSGHGLVDSWCSPPYCKNHIPCADHPQATQRYWHYSACEHGQSDSHKIIKGQQCYRCSGTGKFDYGNKLISITWDGSPLRLKDGNIVKQPPTELERRIAAYVKLDS